MIDPVATEYVYNNLDIYSVPYFNNFKHLSSLYTEWSGKIYFDSFSDQLNTQFEDILDVLNSNTQIYKFVLAYEYRKMIESFVETDEFKQKVLEIHQNIYSYLRSNGLVKNDVDWCDCTKPLEIYLFFALNNIVEDIDKTTLETYTQDQIGLSVFKAFENEDEFNLFVNSFNESNSYYLFEFYKTFVTSLVAVTFSKAMHLNFGV
jgi:hypothetical protein